jgi:hypothetical protein
MKRLPPIAFSLLALASGLRADVSVSPLFSDHAVLQADVPPIFVFSVKM